MAIQARKVKSNPVTPQSYFGLYAKESLNDMTRIQRYLKNTETHGSEILQRLHSMKGVAKALLLDEHVTHLFLLEQLAVSQDWESLARLLGHFKIELEKMERTYANEIPTATFELEEFLTFFEPLARKSNVSLVLIHNISIPIAWRPQIFSWVSGLLQNSLAHAFKSHKTPPMITIAGTRNQSLATISVEDNGGGIDVTTLATRVPEEMGKRLHKISHNKRFKAHELQLILEAICLHEATTRDIPTPEAGRGVGLSTMRREIESVQGRLSLKTTGPLGTSFQISLDLAHGD